MKTITLYNKRTNSFVDVEETKEDVQRRLKTRRIIRFLEMKAKEEYKLEHKNGYCPICGMLIPLSGECECGYRR